MIKHKAPNKYQEAINSAWNNDLESLERWKKVAEGSREGSYIRKKVEDMRNEMVKKYGVSKMKGL